MIVARGRHGAELHCRRYFKGALHHWSRGNPAPLQRFSAGDVAIRVDADRVLALSGGRFTGNADPTRLPRRVVATLTWSPLGLPVPGYKHNEHQRTRESRRPRVIARE
jgi:hypothetical protein